MNRKGCTSPPKEREETRKEQIKKKANISDQPNQLERNMKLTSMVYPALDAHIT